MQALIHVIPRGIAIGVLISAPMGPIGMLVIQRTLAKGRRPAFYTGVGAAISDLLYCLLTGFALSFVSDIVEKNQLMLQILGSIVLGVFAYFLFRSKPTRRIAATPYSSGTCWKDLVSGFLLTFSNPLILFFIVGLYARFSFLLPEFRAYHYIVGYGTIFAGALLWWFTITYLVNKLRARFNLRALIILNRIVGTVLFVMALVGLVMGLIDYSAINP